MPGHTQKMVHNEILSSTDNLHAITYIYKNWDTYKDEAGGNAVHGQLSTSQQGLSGNDHISSTYIIILLIMPNNTTGYEVPPTRQREKQPLTLYMYSILPYIYSRVSHMEYIFKAKPPQWVQAVVHESHIPVRPKERKEKGLKIGSIVVDAMIKITQLNLFNLTNYVR